MRFLKKKNQFGQKDIKKSTNEGKIIYHNLKN